MKFNSLLLFIAFVFSFLQHGCGNASNSNQSSANNQSVTIASPTPTPSPTPISTSPTVTPSVNQNPTNNGASEAEVRDVLELNERCKHTPVGKAKVTPITGVVPLKVTFDGSSSYDPDGTKIIKWEWHFGNGQSGEGKNITYIYDKPGKYGIILNIVDSQGQKTFDCSDGGTDINITVLNSENTNVNSVQKENK